MDFVETPPVCAPPQFQLYANEDGTPLYVYSQKHEVGHYDASDDQYVKRRVRQWQKFPDDEVDKIAGFSWVVYHKHMVSETEGSVNVFTMHTRRLKAGNNQFIRPVAGFLVQCLIAGARLEYNLATIGYRLCRGMPIISMAQFYHTALAPNPQRNPYSCLKTLWLAAAHVEKKSWTQPEVPFWTEPETKLFKEIFEQTRTRPEHFAAAATVAVLFSEKSEAIMLGNPVQVFGKDARSILGSVCNTLFNQYVTLMQVQRDLASLEGQYRKNVEMTSPTVAVLSLGMCVLRDVAVAIYNTVKKLFGNKNKFLAPDLKNGLKRLVKGVEKNVEWQDYRFADTVSENLARQFGRVASGLGNEISPAEVESFIKNYENMMLDEILPGEVLAEDSAAVDEILVLADNSLAPANDKLNEWIPDVPGDVESSINAPNYGPPNAGVEAQFGDYDRGLEAQFGDYGLPDEFEVTKDYGLPNESLFTEDSQDSGLPPGDDDRSEDMLGVLQTQTPSARW